MSGIADPNAPSMATGFDLSTVPEAERDEAWLKHYYAGDDVPQFTLRAVIMGGVIGAFMSVANLYTTLKIGWSFGITITACVLSYAIWNAFVKMGVAKDRMTMLENNCMQSTASAAGYSTGGTLATSVGALLLLNGDAQRLHWIPTTIWVGLTALLGVVLAIPMKRQMINREQLPFPSGIAAAATLKSLYAEGRESIQKGRALLMAMGAGALVAAFRSGLLGRLKLNFIPEILGFNGTIFRLRNMTVNGSQLPAFGFEPSLLLLAAGLLVGLKVCSWMFLGAVLNYFVVFPNVLLLPDWIDPNNMQHFMGEIEYAGSAAAPAMFKLTKWSLWFGTSVLVASGLTSFALGWKTIARAFQRKSALNVESDVLANVEVPSRWFVVGMIPVSVGLIFLCWLSLGIKPWLGLVSIGLAYVLALVCSRATGETDVGPIGAMGKITQFTYAALDPGNSTSNLISAGVTAGAAGSCADLLTDLKSGYILGANPRQQFWAQLSGVFFGVIAVVPAWYLLVPNAAALEAFNSPATGMWLAVAKALSTGVTSIPLMARWSILVGGILGVVFQLIDSKAPATLKKFTPSTMGFALGFILPFASPLSFFLGAVGGFVWSKMHKESYDKYVVSIASGCVGGQSFVEASFSIIDAQLPPVDAA